MSLTEKNKIADIPSNISLNEIRSSEVQDIISAIPNNLIRFGSLAVLLVIILLIAGSNFITYPDILPAEILITTTSPPVKVVAGSPGELKKVFVSDGEIVNKDQVLGVVDNTATYEDVLILSKVLLNEAETDLLAELKLGEISLSASQFIDGKNKLSLYLSLGLFEKQKRALLAQIDGYKLLRNEQGIQQDLLEQNVILTQNNYTRNQKLFEEGVLALQQFEINEKELLFAKRELSSINQSISSTNLSIISLQKSILELELKDRDENSKLEQSIEQNLRNLKASILLWQEKYLLTSPINGTVTFLDQWSEGQYVKQGEVLFWIDPKFSSAIGKVKLPLNKSGKVRLGQKVNIKLDNYPYEEYGQLLGRVKSISALPHDKFYLIDVEFPDGLITSHQMTLDFRQQMQGMASIVTEDLSLLDRVFYQFRKLYYSR